jgi:hypothetical protein
MEEPAVNPFETGFASAWEELKEACGSIPVCTECSKCSLRDSCFACPARLKSETGYYNKPAPYICEYTRQKGCFNK